MFKKRLKVLLFCLLFVFFFLIFTDDSFAQVCSNFSYAHTYKPCTTASRYPSCTGGTAITERDYCGSHFGSAYDCSYQWEKIDCHSLFPSGCGDEGDGGSGQCCIYSDWTDGNCDDGDCTATQRRQNRSVDPSGCTSATRCVDDSSCPSCTATAGVCGSSHYGCTTGTLGPSAEYANDWQWWCNGDCGGANTWCQEIKPTCSSCGTYPRCFDPYFTDLGCGGTPSCSGGTANPAPSCTDNGCGCTPVCGGTSGPAPYCADLNGCGCSSNSCSGGVSNPASHCDDLNGCGCSSNSCSGGVSNPAAYCDASHTCGCTQNTCSGGVDNPCPTASCSVAPNPLANGANPGITLSSTNASYCYVYHDWANVNTGYFTSGTYYPGAQTSAGTHEGEVYCYNSSWFGSGWATCPYQVLYPIPAPPTISASCFGNQATVSWNTPTYTDHFSFRLDNQANSWTGACPATNPGDACFDTYSNSYVFTATYDQSYGSWIHAASNGGMSSASNTATFTCHSPSCTVSLLPNTLPSPIIIPFWATQNIIASVTPSYGTVRSVAFSSGDTGLATVNPATDSTSTYQTAVRGELGGDTNFTARVTMNDAFGNSYGEVCSVTVPIRVNYPKAWWQVKDGDITTNGNIISPIITATGAKLILDGLGGFPGVPVYGGSLGVGLGVISSKLWNANTTTSQERLFNYAYFESLIPDDLTFNDVSILPSGTGAILYGGYEWYKTTLDLNISGIDFGSRKVVLFMKGANLNINGNINLTDGSGFFGTFVDGTIVINPAVTEIEGIYLTDHSFATGTGSSVLWIRGSVASYGSLTLQRNMDNNNIDNPAELFEYAPDQVLLFPAKLSRKRVKWMEVAP